MAKVTKIKREPIMVELDAPMEGEHLLKFTMESFAEMEAKYGSVKEAVEETKTGKIEHVINKKIKPPPHKVIPPPKNALRNSCTTYFSFPVFTITYLQIPLSYSRQNMSLYTTVDKIHIKRLP